MQKSIALDIGTKKIGVAESDPLLIGVSATWSIVLKQEGRFEECIEPLVEKINKDNIRHVIIGIPLSDSGENTPQAEKVLVFKNLLTKTYNLLHPNSGVSFHLLDENSTTVVSSHETEISRSKHSSRHFLIDQQVARLLLEEFIRTREI